ncbi:MAG: beta-galactosidase [Bifidobacteriaceae bacterium]|nr:beta-galactosidase [Bifidobacteriaceae bacterium]
MRLRRPPADFDPTQVAPWNAAFTGLAFGGDFNPEQWPEELQAEDIALMRQAGVNLVSLAIFAWAAIEPREGEFDWGWLDRTMDRLHHADIKVALATATASPPPWLTSRHPEILPQRPDGARLNQGSRQAYSVSHPLHRAYALRLAEQMARRYGRHPALAMWHVDNEIGCHVPRDYSPSAARDFREWLRAKYKDIAALNAAWGAAFWSGRHSDFEEILPPLATPTFANPAHRLDFDRYSSDALLDYYLDLRDTLRAITPHIPMTTNFMVSRSVRSMDYFTWADEVDVIANDHYTQAADPLREIDLAFAADISRGLARGAPWMLMEHSTSAVNFQPRNRAKLPGEMLRNSMAHVARGSDAAMFFQWRQSRFGAEKFHSAMLPHAGVDSDVWRDVVALGGALRAIGEVRGARLRNRAAVVLDWPSWWAVGQEGHPSTALVYADQLRAWHRALWRAGIVADMTPATGDLANYDLIVAPTLYLVSDAAAANIAAAAERGASVIVTYFSGIADQAEHVRLGGYPGAFRELVGVRVEEFWPLQEGESVALAGEIFADAAGLRADLWTEKARAQPGVEVLAAYGDGPLAGRPAVTRRPTAGGGAAWYVTTRLPDAAADAVVAALSAESGVKPEAASPVGVEVTRRWSDDSKTSWLFAINHTDRTCSLQATGVELLTGARAEGALEVPAGAVRVLREARPGSADAPPRSGQ